MISTVAGASISPALDTYAGPGPFSEPESRSLSTYITSVADRIDLYLSFHSFSQLLLLPFGNSTQPYANYHDAVRIFEIQSINVKAENVTTFYNVIKEIEMCKQELKFIFLSSLFINLLHIQIVPRQILNTK